MVTWWRRQLKTRNRPRTPVISRVSPESDLPDISSLLKANGPGSILFYGAAGAPLTDTWSITVPVRPFSADHELDPASYRVGEDGPRLIETSYRLDFIDFPKARSLENLKGRSFEFPTNPSPGYIDGSIYLCTAHNPADVSRIVFGDVSADAIEARIFVHVNFDHEGVEAQDFDTTLELLLRETHWTDPLASDPVHLQRGSP